MIRSAVGCILSYQTVLSDRQGWEGPNLVRRAGAGGVRRHRGRGV